MAGLNVSLSLSLHRRQSSSDKKHYVLFCFFFTFRCCSAESLQFSSSTVKHETIPLQFARCFSLFYKKNSSRKTFLVECLRSSSFSKGAASCKHQKRREFRRKTHTTVASDWTYHFSHMWKNTFCDSDWTYHFFYVWKTSFALLIGWNSFTYVKINDIFVVYNKEQL